MKTYLKGIHDLETFPPILLSIKHNGVYEIPFGQRTYIEIDEYEWLTNNEKLQKRNVDQTNR